MKRSLVLLILFLAACNKAPAPLPAEQVKALAKHKQDTEDCHKQAAETPLKHPGEYGQIHDNCMRGKKYVVGQ